MSGSTITQAFVQQWDTSLRHELGQKDSRFMKAVTDRGTITGESFTINNLDDDGSLMPVNSVRHGDTQMVQRHVCDGCRDHEGLYDAKAFAAGPQRYAQDDRQSGDGRRLHGKDHRQAQPHHRQPDLSRLPR